MPTWPMMLVDDNYVVVSFIKHRIGKRHTDCAATNNEIVGFDQLSGHCERLVKVSRGVIYIDN